MKSRNFYTLGREELGGCVIEDDVAGVGPLHDRVGDVRPVHVQVRLHAQIPAR